MCVIVDDMYFIAGKGHTVCCSYSKMSNHGFITSRHGASLSSLFKRPKPLLRFGVYSKENLETKLLEPGEASLSFSSLHQSETSKPTKTGWSLNQSVRSCLRLPGPCCHTSVGACGWNR